MSTRIALTSKNVATVSVYRRCENVLIDIEWDNTPSAKDKQEIHLLLMAAMPEEMANTAGYADYYGDQTETARLKAMKDFLEQGIVPKGVKPVIDSFVLPDDTIN